jgi:hypothetical protein
LLHLLTAPDSNITGVYPLVPRIAGAEIGWTVDQWLQVIHRLQDEDLARYDDLRLIVWVRIWWDHHSATQVTGPKLRARALEEIRRIPSEWMDDFLTDFKERLSDDQQNWLDESLRPRSNRCVDEVSHGCRIDTVSNKAMPNTKQQPKQSTETPTSPLTSRELDMSGIPPEHRTDVHRALVKAKVSGKLRHKAQLVVNAMAENYRSASGKPHNAMALTLYLAENLNGGTT